ncbi:MAG: hypothetical protein ACPG7F_02550 [Aggregatilineales bacterium]
MTRPIKLFKIAGLRLSFDMTAVLALSVMGIILAFIANSDPVIALPEAILAGFLCVVIHALSEFLHNIGHSIAARRTGYPMIGVHFFLIIAASLYPRDEGDLPAGVHIRRALGGPIFSFFVAIVCGVIAALVWEQGGWVRFVAGFAFFINLLVYSLGAFLPVRIGDNFSLDGGTIMHWMRHK